MGFWSWLTGTDARTPENVTPNSNPPGVPPTVGFDDWTPGDPDGFELLGDPLEFRALPTIIPSPWDGWPAGWDTPLWNQQVNGLVDTAWACIDLNSSVLAAMPVYKLRSGQIVEPETWMINPDPRIYPNWYQFAKSLFWEYHLGEAFVLATNYFSNGWPMFFRVIPSCYITDREMGDDGKPHFKIGSLDVTQDIRHIPYKLSNDGLHGIGPLDAAGARVTAAAVMSRYVSDIVRNGGINLQTLETEQLLPEGAAQTISDQWVEAARSNLARPRVIDAGLKLVDHQLSPRDMALIEVAQFTDARICTLLGVPPYLMALPSGASDIYSNVSQLFDFHDRASLRPKATDVMTALSGWALPRGSTVELNRDEYSRPALPERATAYQTLVAIGALTAEEVRAMERFNATSPTAAASALTGDTTL